MLVKFIISYYKKAPFKILIGFLSLILVDLAQLISPRLVQKAIDSVVTPGDSSSVLLVVALSIFGLAIGIGVFRFAWRMTIIGMSHFIEMDFKNRLFDHLLSLTSKFFNKTKTGDIMARMTNDMRAVRMATAFGVIAGFDATFLFIATLVFMFTINVKLTLFAIIPLPLISIIALFFMKLLYRKFRMVQEGFAAMSDKAQEMYSGIKIIQAFQQEEDEAKNFNKLNREYVDMNISLIKIWGTMHPMIFLLSQAGIAIILFVGGQQVILGQLTPGELVAFISYIGIIVWPMMAVGFVTNVFQRGAASYSRIRDFMEEESDIKDSEDAQYRKIEGNIELMNVSFKYNDNYVLENIDLKVNKGDYIGICGSIGTGKTTIAKLILRIIEPDAGAIYYDGNYHKDIKIAGVRDSIGYVPQDSFLFSETIEENIRFGKPDADRKEIERVCSIASVHDNIMELRDNYRTIVGEKGVTLSGGQKQRICIARAIIRKPPVLILDDALSAVDTNTEKEIISNLKEYTEGITTIVISHRISSFLKADRIFVLNNNVIESSGKHEELLEQSETYKHIYEIQKLEE
ncbi:MAG: ABC transporter ATP-binding protein [candidate division WOR-3 bacterium]|nr:ABC transporter ATP-binding protein [candidate division WOR-3 bacterium]